MYSFEWMIGVALVALAGGLGLGTLLGQSLSSTRKVRTLQQELEAAQTELSDYRADVYDQFAETARKFERLNETYNDLHQQLATSASKLLGDTAGTPLLVGPIAERVIESSEPEAGFEPHQGAPLSTGPRAHPAEATANGSTVEPADDAAIVDETSSTNGAHSTDSAPPADEELAVAAKG